MPSAAVLSGELGLLSLFDLGQLLMLNGASGELHVACDGRRGFFFFDHGQIVNAVDDEHHEGEGAALRLFMWKRGTFEFRPGAPSGSRAIVESTEGLMMEAARRMDESGTGDAAGEADKLAQRASSLEALREAFLSVASETRGLPAGDPGSEGSAFALLRDAADALLFRPGHAPRVRVGGRWRNVGALALDPAAYDQLRARLLDGVRGAAAEPHTRGVHACVVTGDDGRRYAVTRVAGEHEALWLRAAALPPPASGEFDGPLDTWRGALAGTAGLLLAAGPDADAADRLLHASVALLARERGGTLLLVADHDRWAHDDAGGVLLRATAEEAAALLAALAPEAVAFDHAHAAASSAALDTAPRVLAAVVANDAAGALARWCACVGRRWGDGIETVLPGAHVDVVLATGPRAPDGRLPFAVTRLAFAPAASEPASAGVATAPEPEPPAAEPESAPAAPVTAAPEAAAAEPPPAARALPADPMEALAAELSRSLRKAA